MNFSLITKNGKVMVFYVKAVCELYQQIYGGVIMTAEIFEEELV